MLNMKYLLWLLCLACTVANSQPVYKGNPKDTILLNKLLDSVINAGAVTYTDCKSTIFKAKSIVHKSDNKFYAAILAQEAFIYSEASQFEKAAQVWDSAADIYERIHLTKQLTTNLGRSGIAYVYASKYALASDRLFKAMKLAEKYGYKKTASSAFINIGVLYESLQDWENALIYAKKGLVANWELKDTVAVAMIYGNIGNLFQYQNQYDSAIHNFEKVLALPVDKLNTNPWIAAYINLANAYLSKKMPNDALKALDKASPLMNQFTEKDLQANIFALKSLAYSQKNDLTQAGTFALKSYEIGHQIEDYEYLKNLYQSLFEYYNKTGKYDKAITYLQKITAIIDTLNKESKKTEYQKVAIRYELNKKVESDSLRAEQKVLVATDKTIKTRNTLLIVALLLVATLAIAIILYNRSKLLQRKNIIAVQEKQLAEQAKNTYQLKTLQAQMNPHFIFNCFNTIDSFILQNKQYEASLLVQRFSKLSRKILEQTAQDAITIQEEFSTLATYLQIEKQRATHPFDFTIKESDFASQYLIPPMLLQPFVENALIHGIRPLQKEGGLISIDIVAQENDIEITITDNGIGREQAEKLKADKQTDHRSMSTDLTMQRLSTLHPGKTQDDYLKYVDLTGAITGTSVKIIIPKMIANA
jgi:tetratricopeptide (TPR) repeat protein